MKILVLILVLAGSATTHATSPTVSNNLGHGGKDSPCQKVKSACEAAGFVGGDRNAKKKLWKDCVDPLMAGKSVEGVTVSAKDVEACKMK